VPDGLTQTKVDAERKKPNRTPQDLTSQRLHREHLSDKHNANLVFFGLKLHGLIAVIPNRPLFARKQHC